MRNILIVDTDLVSIEIYKECFAADTLNIANSDSEIKDILRAKTNIDIIIVDTDSFVFFKEAQKNLIEHSPNIPIIVCSADERGGDALNSLSVSSVDYISKPIQPKSLQVRVESLCTNGSIDCTRKSRIMVIDDCDVQRERLAYILSQTYLVETYKSATEAISEIDSGNEPDLIVVDIIMDDVSGFEFIEYVRHSKDLEIPIMCISTKAIPKFVNTAFNLGANDYVYKPYNKSQLKKKVRLLL